MNDTTHNSSARLQFLSDWQIILHGETTPRGKLIINYDTKRLPNFRKIWFGADIQDVEVYIRFHPKLRIA